MCRECEHCGCECEFCVPEEELPPPHFPAPLCDCHVPATLCFSEADDEDDQDDVYYVCANDVDGCDFEFEYDAWGKELDKNKRMTNYFFCGPKRRKKRKITDYFSIEQE